MIFGERQLTFSSSSPGLIPSIEACNFPGRRSSFVRLLFSSGRADGPVFRKEVIAE
jgi:hypothetical protein